MSRYTDDESWDEPERERDYRDCYGLYRAPPHSGLGIASCIIGGCTFLFGIILVVIAGVLEASRPGGVDEESPEAMVMGLLMVAGAALVGLVLGIVSAAMGKRNKLFPGLGIGINALLFVGLTV